MDEKSLIKKYQREITSLKQELQQLKRGMMENPFLIANNQEDLINLKLQVCFLQQINFAFSNEALTKHNHQNFLQV